MLPVALTSPLWWVTRWSSRLLTGFAVAVALSLGGPVPGDVVATVPSGVALPTTAAAPPTAGPWPALAAGAILSAPAAPGSATAPAAPGSAVGSHAGPGSAAGSHAAFGSAAGGHAAVGHGTLGWDVAGWPERPIVAEPTGRSAGAVAAAATAPAGPTPTVAGPRAPPAG